MKIITLKDLDLSKYKLAYFRGDSMEHDKFCQDDVMKLAEIGKAENTWGDKIELKIALIPKEARLTDCGGDDWNDTPASSNASGFYEYPKGTIFLEGELGKELTLKQDDITK